MLKLHSLFASLSGVLPLATLPGFTIILFLFIPAVQAQSASVYVDIGPCMGINEDEDRYACYDQLEEQIRAARSRESELPVVSIQRNIRAAQQQEVADATEENDSNNDEQSVVEEFGRQSPAISQSRVENARVLANEDGEQELVDTISSLRERLPSQWAVTLAGGQVWHQVNSKAYRLREGMEIRIYPSPFGGSFRLSATNLNGFIQVRRVQ